MFESTVSAPRVKHNFRCYSVHQLISMTRNLDDYRPGWPAGVGASIDQETCDEMQCGSCMHTGMLCCPYHHTDGSGYKVFAVCEICDAIEEV